MVPQSSGASPGSAVASVDHVVTRALKTRSYDYLRYIEYPTRPRTGWGERVHITNPGSKSGLGPYLPDAKPVLLLVDADDWRDAVTAHFGLSGRTLVAGTDEPPQWVADLRSTLGEPTRTSTGEDRVRRTQRPVKRVSGPIRGFVL